MKNQKNGAKCLVACAILAAGILIFRIGYDITVYFRGNTIAIRATKPFDYLLHLPRGYCDFKAPYPLLIFLHGAGETGQDVSILEKMDPFYYANRKVAPEDFPFIVVSPITPIHGWKPEWVVEFLDSFLADSRFRYRIDESRIYLTGFSMGGFGTFDTAARFPNRFAAIVPLSGGFGPEGVEKLLTVPIWAFHGDTDDIVPFHRSKECIDEMIKLHHPNARLTPLPGFGHSICEEVYGRSELYQWLLQQKLPHEEKKKQNKTP